MSADAPDPIYDALLAARLVTLAPSNLGGIALRGAGPSRDAVIAALGDVMPLRRLPGHIDDERLLGGIDIAASLAAGHPVQQAGLLDEARGGALIVPMAERLDDAIAGRLAQALDAGDIALVLLDDGIEPEDAPPGSLMERCAFHCDLTLSREWQGIALPCPAGKRPQVEPLGEDS